MNEVKSIDIHDELVREALNDHLDSVTGHSVLTPYIGLEAVRKVLAYYKIFIPTSHLLNGACGYEVFAANQFGEKMGVKDNGEVVTATELPFHIYYEWQKNEHGKFDVFASIVTDDELEEITADAESEEEELAEDKKNVPFEGPYSKTVPPKTEKKKHNEVTKLAHRAIKKVKKKHLEEAKETELDKGIKDEMDEHGFSRAEATKVAKDHLKKNKHYYSKLEKVGLEESDKAPFDNPTKEKSTPYKNPHSKAKQLARAAMKRQLDSMVADAKMSSVYTKRASKNLKEENLNEISGKLARKAEHKAAKKYYNDYDDETAARRKALKDKTPESTEKAEQAKGKREKSAKRVIKFQNYADKKLNEMDSWPPGAMSDEHAGRINKVRDAEDKAYREKKKSDSKKKSAEGRAKRKEEPYLPFGKNALKHYKSKKLDEVSGAKLGAYLVKGTKQRKDAQEKLNKDGMTRDEYRTAMRRVAGKDMAVKKLTGGAKVLAKEDYDHKAKEGAEESEKIAKKLNYRGQKRAKDAWMDNAKWLKKKAVTGLDEDNLQELSKGKVKAYYEKSKKEVDELLPQTSKTFGDISKLSRRITGSNVARRKLGHSAKVLAKEENLQELSGKLASRYLQKKRERDYTITKVGTGTMYKRKKPLGFKQANTEAKNTINALKRIERDNKVNEERLDEVSFELAKRAQKGAEKKGREYDDKSASAYNKSVNDKRMSEKGKAKAREDDVAFGKKADKKWKQSSKFREYASKKLKEDNLNELTYQKIRNAYEKAKKYGKHAQADRFKKASEKKDELQARYDDLEYKGD